MGFYQYQGKTIKMKRLNFTFLLIIISALSINAQKSSSFSADLTFATRSIWHGWDINGNKPAVHPYVDYAIGNTGLKVAFWASLPIDRNLKEFDDIEFLLKYNKSVFNDNAYKIAVNSFIDYIVCPNVQMDTNDGGTDTKMLWKYNLGLTLPSLIKVGEQAIVPGYNLYYIFPFGDRKFTDGSVHELSSYYTIPVLSGIKIGGAVNYHTGVFGKGSGWTHATSSISTSVKAGIFKINGALNKQWSFDERKDITDEFWATLGISTNF
jgi:hypothetical protein